MKCLLHDIIGALKGDFFRESSSPSPSSISVRRHLRASPSTVVV